jgi:hypothetical protein
MTDIHNVSDERLRDLANHFDGVNADAAMAMRELLSHRQRSRWVDAQERLPDREGWYECTSSEPWPPQVYVLEFRMDRYGGHWSVDGVWHGYVTAWRPLPAPFKGASHG